MTAGRPRIYDYEKEADDLEKWSLQDDALSLYDFTDPKPYLAQDLTDFAKRCDKFALALKKAKERIGRRREKYVHLETFNYGVWNRSARLYDPLLVDREDADKKFEAALKKESENKNDKQVIVNVHSDGLASGSKVSSKTLSTKNNNGTE